MSLRTKTFVIIAVTMIALISVLLSLEWRILAGGLSRIEEDQVRLEVARVQSVIQNDLEELLVHAGDYGGWDDTYQFVGGYDFAMDHNKAYVQTNFRPETLANLRVNLMAVADNNNRVLMVIRYNDETGKLEPPPKDFAACLTKFPQLCSHASVHNKTAGILTLDGGAWLLASRPVTDNADQAPVRGGFIIGRELDGDDMKRLKKLSHLEFALHPAADPAGREAWERCKQSPGGSVLWAENSDRIHGYAVLNDLGGEPVLALDVAVARTIYQQGLKNIFYFGVFLLAASLGFFLAMMLSLHYLVLARLRRLNCAVRAIGASGDLAQRLPVRYPDELGSLASEVNQMLSRQESIQRQLRMSEANYRAIVEDQTELICRFRADGSLSFVNDACLRFFAASREDILKLRFAALSPDSGEEVWPLPQLAALTPNDPTVTYEQWIRRETQVRWLQWTVRARYDSEQRLAEFQAVGRDVTERRVLEQDNRAIAERERSRLGRDLHDNLGQQLTGIAFLGKTLEQKLAARSQPEAQNAAKLVELINAAIGQTRGLAKGLFPEALEGRGLVSSLGDLANRTRALYGIECTLNVDGQPREFANETALQLYRIAQEAVTNAIKHGRPQRVTLHLHFSKDANTLGIEDDGCGIAALQTGGSSVLHEGMGLRVMKHRAALIGGTLDIRSGSVKGTRVVCTFRESSGTWEAVRS